MKYLKKESCRSLKIIEYLKQKLSEKMYHAQSDSRSSIYIETQFIEDPFENLTYEVYYIILLNLQITFYLAIIGIRRKNRQCQSGIY